MYNIGALRNADCGAIGILQKKPATHDIDAEKSVFLFPMVAERATGYFYGLSGISDRFRQKLQESSYREVAMAKIVKQSAYSRFRTPDAFVHEGAVGNTAKIVTALSCSLQFINNAEYVSEGENLEGLRTSHQKYINESPA